jgi:hypothetical protein
VDLRRAAVRLLGFIIVGIVVFASYGFFLRGTP